MKNQHTFVAAKLLYILALLFVSESIIGQGQIMSINPPSAFSGESVTLIVQGMETGFVQDETDVSFPEFISVESIYVNNPDLLTLKLKIDKSAPAGSTAFTIFTPSNKYTGEFEIVELAGDPESMITVYPVQSINLSDFDFSNLQNLPLLFTITVYAASHDFIQVYIELQHETYGMVAAAYKDLHNPGFMASFDNRQFDGYDTEKASDEIIESAVGNGSLPSGEYWYTISLFDKNHNLLGQTTTSEFYIPESISGIDLIAPGFILGNQPELIFSNTPFFQWFGGLSEYRFSLYEVLDGQISSDEIVGNLPVFQTDGLSSTEYLYPSYAEPLEDGKTYAWQITSSIISSGGPQQIASDVYWFTFRTMNKSNMNLDKIELFPDDIDLLPGDSIQLHVRGFDSNGDSLQVECEWDVTPKFLGRVNSQGWFVAGGKAGTVAVSAKCGSQEEYITINIKAKK